MRAFSSAFAIGAVALSVVVAPAFAQDNRVADVTPFAVPAELIAVRAQPAIGPTAIALAPGQQPLSPALLANYVARQQQLRAFDVDNAINPAAPLSSELLMGYIARGSFGGSNGALSAIDSFTTDPVAAEPDLNPGFLASYIADGYQTTAQRMDRANTERGCLAQAIYHEARGESEAGQLAVANVIVNRARSGQYPGSLCGVIYQNADKGRYRCQFTFACDGRDDAPGERRAWARSVDLAQAVYREYATGEKVGALPGSALFYHTTAVQPSWSHTYNQVAQIGSHIFYSPN